MYIHIFAITFFPLLLSFFFCCFNEGWESHGYLCWLTDSISNFLHYGCSVYKPIHCKSLCVVHEREYIYMLTHIYIHIHIHMCVVCSLCVSLFHSSSCCFHCYYCYYYYCDYCLEQLLFVFFLFSSAATFTFILIRVCVCVRLFDFFVCGLSATPVYSSLTLPTPSLHFSFGHCFCLTFSNSYQTNNDQYFFRIVHLFEFVLEWI